MVRTRGRKHVDGIVDDIMDGIAERIVERIPHRFSVEEHPWMGPVMDGTCGCHPPIGVGASPFQSARMSRRGPERSSRVCPSFVCKRR